MLGLEIIQLLLLLRGKQRSDFFFRILHDGPDALRRFDPDRFELRAGRVENRADLFFLVRSQVERAAKMLPHSVADVARVWRAKHDVLTQMMNADECAGHSA